MPLRFALIFALLAPCARAATSTELLLARAWPYESYARLTELGTGVAVVFSPDLSVPGNCRFYRALGFSCFDDADWSRVLDAIHLQNARFPERAIRTIVLETHGTNGNGLKLQRSHDPDAERSYISVGALQERLEPEGVRYVIISACNSGRLLRPSIYRTLDPDPGDSLFLPATCGIVDADGTFNPEGSAVTVITPASSHIEMTVVGSVNEMAPHARRLLIHSAESEGLAAPGEFAISDVMMGMITHDRSLQLRIGGGVDALSRAKTDEDVSEKLFAAFLRRLNDLGRLQHDRR
ncbi:MAG: hypothetical protein NVSMB68_13370 [Thermoanaerobaculia bacterium]